MQYCIQYVIISVKKKNVYVCACMSMHSASTKRQRKLLILFVKRRTGWPGYESRG